MTTILPGATDLDGLFNWAETRAQPAPFRTVLADPPWNEAGGGKIKRGADRHYPLLKTHEMPAVMTQDCPHWARVGETAHLYLWVTNNFLPDGRWLMAELGFRYVTNRVWAKDRFGLGQYYRGQHELCLFGVRGKGYAGLKARGKFPTLVGGAVIERGEHSAKPEIFYDEVEAVSMGPYLELFARSERAGWQSWGNEVEA